MEVVRTITALRYAVAALRARHGAIALVPTMGALHAGHVALVEAARRHGAVVTSIFVNPLQFGQGEDLARYPRDEPADLAALAVARCDLAWLPDVTTMYGPLDATVVELAGPAERWEGAHRPGHFRGVATVVARLFGQTQPDVAVFGEKDWQQYQVVRRMVADLRMPVAIVGVPTIRAADGLALSSRNRFLTENQRAVAPLLYHRLTSVAATLACGRPAHELLSQSRAALTEQGFTVEYFDLVEAHSLKPLEVLRPPARLIAAAQLGTVRLIDNINAMLADSPPDVQARS